MTESRINAVISIPIYREGEISLNRQISPIVEMTRKKESVISTSVRGEILFKR